jgi:hypothetical protein
MSHSGGKSTATTKHFVTDAVKSGSAATVMQTANILHKAILKDKEVRKADVAQLVAEFPCAYLSNKLTAATGTNKQVDWSFPISTASASNPSSFHPARWERRRGPGRYDWCRHLACRWRKQSRCGRADFQACYHKRGKGCGRKGDRKGPAASCQVCGRERFLRFGSHRHWSRHLQMAQWAGMLRVFVDCKEFLLTLLLRISKRSRERNLAGGAS